MSPSTNNTPPKYTTINLDRDTADLVDQIRAALLDTTGKLSRAAVLTAAVEHYAAALADEGHAIDAIDTDQFTDLAGTKIPFRPRASWAIIDTETIPHRVELATGRGPGGGTVLTVVGEILPHLDGGGRFTSWRSMLQLAGYEPDDSRATDTMPDGRTVIPIITSGPRIKHH
jgi:hypothetical protein